MSKEERTLILDKLYLTTKDIKKLLGVGANQAQKLAKQWEQEARDVKYFIPDSNKYMVPTKYFKKEVKI